MKAASFPVISLFALGAYAIPAPLKNLNEWVSSGPNEGIACEVKPHTGINDFACDLIAKKDARDYAATINVANSFDSFGWNFMVVETTGKYGATDDVQALAAGYLEGHVTAAVRRAKARRSRYASCLKAATIAELAECWW